VQRVNKGLGPQKPLTRAALKTITNANEPLITNKAAIKPLKPVLTNVTKSKEIEVKEDKENAVKIEAKTEIDEDEELREEMEELNLSSVIMDVSSNAQSNAFSCKYMNVVDIDKDDHDDPQLVSDYVNEIYSYMRLLEAEYAIKSNFLEKKEVTAKMRSILINWLVQVHLRFHLLQETLYLTVAVLDRFLQAHEVPKNKLQLVGVTSMLIASKYEEMYAPEIGDFVYITDNAYSSADIRKMECLILRTLAFNLGRPLPLHFLRRNSKAGEVDATHHILAKYLIELTLTDYDLASVNPSEVAAAALCLAMKILNRGEWNDTVMYYSTYKEAELTTCMKRLIQLVLKANGKLDAICTKYKSQKFNRIATLPELDARVLKSLLENL
jgi:cyclin B